MCREVLRGHEEECVIVGGGGEKILVGELEHAEIVVHGGFLIVRAELLGVLKGGCHAALAGGGVGVTAAERKGVNDVRNIAHSGCGEEVGVGHGFLGEGGREEPEVSLVGAIWCVAAVVAAVLPLRSGERREEQEEQEGGGNHVHRLTDRKSVV